MPEGAVRQLSALLLAAAALATPASAASVDTRLLVLQKSDVPTGFRLDRHASGYRTNAVLARGNPQTQSLLAKSGRVAGYSAQYEKGTAAILSAAHLFRGSAGAHVFLAAQNAEQRALNAERIKRRVPAYRHEAPALGDEASLYRSSQAPKVTLILWRSGRAVATLTTWGLGRDRTVALARAQQRRIENALG